MELIALLPSICLLLGHLLILSLSLPILLSLSRPLSHLVAFPSRRLEEVNNY